jgi:hypothetical protein
MLCLAVALDTSSAHAQKTQIEKTGTELGDKEWDEDKLPSKTKIFVGLGSIPVMIIVVKYL